MTNVDFLKEQLRTNIMPDIMVQSAFHRMLAQVNASNFSAGHCSIKELEMALEQLNTERREEVKARVARRT